MAKRYSKRASKKRAYKKRSTIRKLKTTLRRKIQRGGGNPEEELIKMILGLLPLILPVVLKNLDVFIKILTIILGSGVRIMEGGSKFSREQRGGGLSAVAKQQLLTELGKLKESFQADPAATACIDRFITKYSAEPVDTSSSPSIEGASQNEINPAQLLTSEIQSEIQQTPAVETPNVNEIPAQSTESTMEKIKRILTERINGIKPTIDSQIEGLFQKIKAKSGMDDADIACLRTLKAAILADMSGKVSDRIEKVKNSDTFSLALEIYEKAKNIKENAKGRLSSFTNNANARFSSFADNAKERASDAAIRGVEAVGNAAGNLAVGAFKKFVFKS